MGNIPKGIAGLVGKDVWIKLFNIFFVILNKKRSKKDFAKIILSILFLSLLIRGIYLSKIKPIFEK